MRRLLLACCLLLAAPAPAASTSPPGYATATDWLEREGKPERYSPLNLLDGRDTTAWCAVGESPPSIVIGFKDVVTVDEVRVYTGDGTTRDAFKAHARARKLTLTGVDTARSFTVEDKRGLQAIQPLTPPLTSARLTLEVVDRFPGARADAPVCITDIVFYSAGKPLNGTFLAPKLRHDARLEPLLGTWFGGLEGAPDRFLSFFVDGTYRFSQEPLEAGAPTRVVGAYAVSGNKLTLELPKKGRVTVRFERGGPAGGPRPGATLELEGALPEEWGKSFRGQP